MNYHEILYLGALPDFVDAFQFGKNCITINTSHENLCFSAGVLSSVTYKIWIQVIIVCLVVVEVYIELRDMLRYLVRFCDMSCPLVDMYQCFEGTCCIYLEVSYPEGEGSKFLCKPNHKGQFTHSMLCPCRSPAMPCR
jgi:hypothetical protein